MAQKRQSLTVNVKKMGIQCSSQSKRNEANPKMIFFRNLSQMGGGGQSKKGGMAEMVSR